MNAEWSSTDSASSNAHELYVDMVAQRDSWKERHHALERSLEAARERAEYWKAAEAWQRRVVVNQEDELGVAGEQDPPEGFVRDLIIDGEPHVGELLFPELVTRLESELVAARAELEEYHSLTYYDIRDAERALGAAREAERVALEALDGFKSTNQLLRRELGTARGALREARDELLNKRVGSQFGPSNAEKILTSALAVLARGGAPCEGCGHTKGPRYPLCTDDVVRCLRFSGRAALVVGDAQNPLPVWLVERGESVGHIPTVWWIMGERNGDIARDGERWTEVADEATRFASSDAAEAAIDRFFTRLSAVSATATEHDFSVKRDSPRSNERIPKGLKGINVVSDSPVGGAPEPGGLPPAASDQRMSEPEDVL